MSKFDTMLKTQVLRASFSAIYYSGLAKLLTRQCAGEGVIFCLHHVCPDSTSNQDFAPNKNLQVTPTFLASVLELLRQKGFVFLSLDQVAERLKSKGQGLPPFAVFTLDDGYLDNLVHAMPVFQKYDCPFTVYVAPRIAEGTCELWWRALEAIISTSAKVSITMPNETVNLETASLSQKNDAWHKLSPMVQDMNEYEQRKLIQIACAQHGVDWKAQCREAAMTWDDIREMAKSPLATIGAHTLNHYNLKKLPAADADHEMRQSKVLTEAALGKPVRHFAYPYGNTDAAGPREFALCKAAGYETAVVTRLGNIWPDHGNHLHALPRIMVSSRYQTLSAIQALMSGVPAMLSNGFRKLNVD